MTLATLSNIPLQLWVLPIIGALIGWFTNYLAVKMLFHPRDPIRLGIITLQGVFPKRQQAFAHKLGELVSTELISVQDLTSKLKEHAQGDHVIDLITSHIQTIITEKLPRVFPMIALVLNPEMVQTITSAFVDDLRGMLSQLIETLSSGLEQQLDVHTLVEEKVTNFSSDKLEEILFLIMKREFKFIELVGLILGFLIGLAQMIFL
ncbi:MAG: DUF445 family protein, partial [Bdellovibrionales bacterium]|nr:DUF445 family protein [Bdellovibrionales bacterium]